MSQIVVRKSLFNIRLPFLGVKNSDVTVQSETGVGELAGLMIDKKFHTLWAEF